MRYPGIKPDMFKVAGVLASYAGEGAAPVFCVVIDEHFELERKGRLAIGSPYEFSRHVGQHDTDMHELLWCLKRCAIDAADNDGLIRQAKLREQGMLGFKSLQRAQDQAPQEVSWFAWARRVLGEKIRASYKAKSMSS